MAIKKAKKLTTNAIVYLSCSSIVAAYGVYKQSMPLLAFAMWMIQMAHFFKKTKRKHRKKNNTDVDIACTEVVDMSGGCDVCSH